MMARADAVEYSRNAGVLGVLRSPNGMMKSLVGTDPSTSGWDERTVYGGLGRGLGHERQGGAEGRLRQVDHPPLREAAPGRDPPLLREAAGGEARPRRHG